MFPEEKGVPMRTIAYWGVAVALVCFAVGFSIGSGRYSANKASTPILSLSIGGDSKQPSDVDFSPVWKAWNVIDENFVPAGVATSTKVASTTEEKYRDRVWGMISGLAGSLNDPYTYFLPPVESHQFADDLSGSFEGVGMEIAVKNEVLTVVSPLKGSPAEKAGLKSGDQILKIDDKDTRGMEVAEAVKQIRGKGGTVVTLSVFREGWTSPREIKVTRDVINVPTVETIARPDGIFVIKLMSFTSNSPSLFQSSLREFVESKDTKLIIDLRGNPGGYLEASVDMASWFLPAGKVVVTEDYAGHQKNIVHRSRGYDVFNDNLRMVILVDKGSASASEILAGALRFYQKGKLVGDTTFGKGSVQELVEITPETSLKVTIARWLGPDGAQIPNTGIIPDVKVKITEDDLKAKKDPQMDKAVEILKSTDPLF